MEITRKEWKPGVVVLELKGPFHTAVESTCLGLEIDQLLRENHTRVVLDLSGVSKIDSGGIGKIVNCYARLEKAGGSLRLCGVHGMIGGVLQITQVDRFLKIYPTAREASESFTD